VSPPLDIDGAAKEELDSVEGLAGHGHEIVHGRIVIPDLIRNP
jgi:hypothetical protein